MSIMPMNNDDSITIAMASIPERAGGMAAVLRTLLPQCDYFDLCLNGYPMGFHCAEMDDPKVTIFRHSRDMGDRGKFIMANRVKGYYLTVDDDLLYPGDYAYRTVQAIESYQRQAIVGWHGTIYVVTPDPSQPKMRCMYFFLEARPEDVLVHHLGTGCMGYHTSCFQVDWRTMVQGVDDQVGWMAQQQCVPMIVIRHGLREIEENPACAEVGAYKRNLRIIEESFRREQSHNWNLVICDSWKSKRVCC